MSRRLLAFLVAVVFLTHASAWIDVVVDDAFITFRYARHLAEGLGPVYNAGERVEGYTDFAWMVALAGYLRAGGSQPLWAAKALGLASALLALLQLGRLARRLAPSAAPAWAFLPPLLLALSGDFVAQAVSGLETPLYLACALGALVAVLDEGGGASVRRSAAWLAFGALVRPEALLVAAVLGCVDALDRRGWRVPLRRLALVAALLAPYLLWKTWFFGTLVPNTFVAKRVPLSSVWWTAHAWPALRAALRDDLGFGLTLLLAALGVAGRRDLPARATAALAVAVLAYATWVGVDTLPGARFFLPALALALALVGEALRRAAARGRATLAAALVALVLAGAQTARADRELSSLTHGITERLYHAHGLVLDEIRRRGARVVALRDIGLVGWYAPDVRIVDLAGLTDRTIAALPGALGEKPVGLDLLIAREVDLLVAHADRPPRSGDAGHASLTDADLSPTIRGILTDPRFARTYAFARSIPFSEDHHLYLFVRRPP